MTRGSDLLGVGAHRDRALRALHLGGGGVGQAAGLGRVVGQHEALAHHAEEEPLPVLRGDRVEAVAPTGRGYLAQ